jgi:hypothetical protein
LFQVHQVVHAREEQPLTAAQTADERVVERARFGLVAGDRPRGGLDEALALGDLADERGAIRVGRTGDTGHDSRSIGRPAATGGQGGGEAESRPGVAVVADRLGDVPFPLVAWEAECLVRGGVDERGERVGQGRELRGDRRSGPVAGAASDLPPDPDELPGLETAPRRDDVRGPPISRASTHAATGLRGARSARPA